MHDAEAASHLCIVGFGPAPVTCANHHGREELLTLSFQGIFVFANCAERLQIFADYFLVLASRHAVSVKQNGLAFFPKV